MSSRLTAPDIRARAHRHAQRKRIESIVGIALGGVALALGLAAVLFVVEAAVLRVILAAVMVIGGIAIHREMRQLAALPTPEACLAFYRKPLDVRRRQLALSIDIWLSAAALGVLVFRRLPGIPWYFCVLVGLGLAGMLAVRYRGARYARREIATLDAMR